MIVIINNIIKKRNSNLFVIICFYLNLNNIQLNIKLFLLYRKLIKFIQNI